jgi:glycosyltransferase involved in cell wall biosynthesis
MENKADRFRIAFVSGKLGDVDGVSLEVDKWIGVLQRFGHEVYTIAGRYASRLPIVSEENSITLEPIRLDGPEQREYERQVFPHLSGRPPQLSTEKRNAIVESLEEHGAAVAHTLYQHIRDLEIDVLIAENTNAMPMTLLGGIAIHRVATEMRVATILHHHDFWWERSRFSDNRISDLLNEIMPPADIGLEHVVISSYAAHILASLKRVAPFVIPNCENFESPVTRDDYNGSFRSEMGFADDDVLVVQPTRIVPRKRIEDTLRLLTGFLAAYPEYRDRLRYIISLYQGDEPNANYIEQIRLQAQKAGIRLHLISDRVASRRGTDDRGRRVFTNRDVLVNADLVTYLPIWEGFGNAILEAMAARVPIVTTTYLVYKTDIKACGIENIEIRDAYDESGALIIPNSVLEAIHHVLTHPKEARARAERNFGIARREFGFDVLRERLSRILLVYGDEIRASRQRLAKNKVNYPV